MEDFINIADILDRVKNISSLIITCIDKIIIPSEKQFNLRESLEIEQPIKQQLVYKGLSYSDLLHMRSYKQKILKIELNSFNEFYLDKNSYNRLFNHVFTWRSIACQYYTSISFNDFKCLNTRILGCLKTQ